MSHLPEFREQVFSSPLPRLGCRSLRSKTFQHPAHRGIFQNLKVLLMDIHLVGIVEVFGFLSQSDCDSPSEPSEVCHAELCGWRRGVEDFQGFHQ